MRGGVFYCRSSECKGKTSVPSKIVNCQLSIVNFPRRFYSLKSSSACCSISSSTAE